MSLSVYVRISKPKEPVTENVWGNFTIWQLHFVSIISVTGNFWFLRLEVQKVIKNPLQAGVHIFRPHVSKQLHKTRRSFVHFLICMLSTPPPSIALWHFWVRFLSAVKPGERPNTSRYQTGTRVKKERGGRHRGEWMRRGERHMDGHSPTDGELWEHLEDTWGCYEPIWFLLQERPSVTNGKVGAGKHISVKARHCWKTN